MKKSERQWKAKQSTRLQGKKNFFFLHEYLQLPSFPYETEELEIYLSRIHQNKELSASVAEGSISN